MQAAIYELYYRPENTPGGGGRIGVSILRYDTCLVLYARFSQFFATFCHANMKYMKNSALAFRIHTLKVESM